jgi:hypothetical protein
MTEIANHSIFKNKPIVLGISCWNCILGECGNGIIIAINPD